MISQSTNKILKALGRLISIARKKRAFSQLELAKRLSVTRQTVIAIEKGSAKVAIGTVLEAAHLLNVPLFAEDNRELSQWQSSLNEFSAMLPKRTRQKRKKVSNDF